MNNDKVNELEFLETSGKDNNNYNDKSFYSLIYNYIIIEFYFFN